MRNQDKYNIEIVRDILKKSDITLLSNEYIDSNTKFLCQDSNGYYVYIILSNFLTRHSIGRWVSKTNDHSIDNINHFLELNNIPFKCISNKYISSRHNLFFKCRRCGKIVNIPWANVYRMDNSSRKHIICPNCDGRTESIHALVLKQIFLHYHPDTSLEDKSYRSKITGKICPTDIVNHRLKIAIEIQSQWHDFEDIKIKDKMKKEYWISKGYSFYSPDIRDYSILEMCQLFFDIQEIPNWIDYNFSNKLNVKEVQELLDKGFTVLNIAEIMGINAHRIYDALHTKKLFYPKNYRNYNLIKENYK